MRIHGQRSVFFGAVLLAAVLAWIALTRPILVDVRFGPMQGDSRLTIWSPIRNRAPERWGTDYLRKIQAPSCREFVSALQIPEKEKSLACDKQAEYAVSANCTLGDRRDEGSVVWLLFECPYTKTNAVANIELILRSERRIWVLQSYERVY